MNNFDKVSRLERFTLFQAGLLLLSRCATELCRSPVVRLRPLAAALSFVAVALVGCEGGALERPPDVGGRDARPNVIVYLIDTLRADHLGIYGYPRPTSPHIDEFAVGGTVFDRAIAQDSKTLGSVASLLTSLHTQSHGLTRFGHKLGPGVVTLAQTMRDA